MYFVTISTSMGAVAERSPLSGIDALQKMNDAAAEGQTATCKDESRSDISLAQLTMAANDA